MAKPLLYGQNYDLYRKKLSGGAFFAHPTKFEKTNFSVVWNVAGHPLIYESAVNKLAEFERNFDWFRHF